MWIGCGLADSRDGVAQLIIEEQWQLRWLMLVRGGVEPKNSWLAGWLA